MTLTLTVPSRTDATERAALPVAVIGAGPIGLAAAAHLLERGLDVVVLEAGASAGASVSQWGHTRLFSPWSELVDAASARLLERSGWTSPDAARLPDGHELVAEYVEPLAAALSPRIRYSTRVTAVSRRGMDRTRTAGRADAPFLLRVETPAGRSSVLARAVIDASGTYSSPNPLGAAGLPVTADGIVHALPDVLGRDREQFAGRHTLVVGAGHSAANTLLKLAALASEVPGTTISWAIRNASPVRVFGSDADELAARGRLGSAVHDRVRAGTIALIDRFEIDDVLPGFRVVGRRGGEDTTLDADVVVNATGFRPDLEMLREIRLGLDEVVEAPRALAPLIDPNEHSCGTVRPHGVAELTHPEPDFYVAGMKSYGRAPTFLLLTGYEQVRSIAAELAGDRAAARDVQLVLPETGVCSSGAGASCDVPAAATAGGCCA
ncbi:FAD-dependent oxidoreductase [Herbiconiux sp. SYSU D00978]|uniref:FAD-dependent oxidoreductase n=1 Tax=Herbiconiux sp. SYSU D00978 TaxID=2812562 RepID=UPI001A97AB70|nr:FAD-dependent oxidoreductase [Herbiconiux sp. SYSU D00978]